MECSKDDDDDLLKHEDFIAEYETKNDKVKIIRINFTSEADCKKWLEDYKACTNTGLIVKDSMSSQPKRYTFHKKWACHLSSLNKVDKSQRNRKCEFVIDILVKKVTKDTKKNDAFLKRDPPLQGKITISGHHNHPVDNFQAFKLLRISEETKKLFLEYFNNGYGVANALHAHEAQLVLKCSDDAELVRNNASLNPLPRTIYYLHSLWLESTYGLAWSATSPIQKLKEKIDAYKEEGVDVIVEEPDEIRWCVLVVTPIMKRAHCRREAKEIIFTDSTASCDAENNVVTFILTATKGGAVPLCLLIHNKQDTVAYTQAYKMLATNYPHCFGKQSFPEVFMTDDCPCEKAALLAVWPESAQYLCHFHVGQAEWRWLCAAANNVDKNLRQTFMKLFQKIMYAVETEDYLEAKENFKESCSHTGYTNRVEKFCSREREWATLFRSETLNRGHFTNNFSEATIRVMKDIALGRTKAYNSCAMVDYVAHPMEEHLQRRLLHYAYCREAKPRLVYNRLLKKMPLESANIEMVEEDLYLVESAEKKGLKYEVNSTVGWCSCPSGKTGHFCKHQAVVFEKYGVGFPNKPAITFQERYELGLLALGPQKCPKIDFFKDFDEVNKDLPSNNSFLEDLEMQVDETVDILQEPENDQSSQNETQAMEEKDIERIQELAGELKNEIDRLNELAQSSNGCTYMKCLETLVSRLKKPSTPGQAMEVMLRFRAAASVVCNRRRSQIGVQPTAIVRRKKGKSRGAGRLRAGRPPTNKPKNPSKPLPRILNASVKANKPHVKSHHRKM